MQKRRNMTAKDDPKSPFAIERTFDAPVRRVWNASTGIEEMKNWYFDIEEFKPEAGFEFVFHAGNGEKDFHHLCKVGEVVPNKKLAYTRRYEGYAGNSLVTFELFPEGKKTRVRFTHEGLDTFPKLPDFGMKNFEMGWTMIIGKSPKEYAEK